jgi:hypothetical protein
MVDQRAERARPDILATDEPQPIDPLLVGQPCYSVLPTKASEISPAG